MVTSVPSDFGRERAEIVGRTHHSPGEELMAHEHDVRPGKLGADLPTRSAAECGFSHAALTWRPLVQPGMYVADVAGDDIGQVKEVRAGDFLVDRSGSLGLSPSTLVYLPFERIHVMMGDRMTLDIPSSQVDDHGTVPVPVE
jgi:hypothetical protein